MLKFRIIARLDVRNNDLIRRVNCEGVRKVGPVAEFAERFVAGGVDELLFFDAVASLYGRGSMATVVDHVSRNVFVPNTVCGGIRSEDNVRELLLNGADKVGLNTAVVEDPELIYELATKFGSSTIALQLDVKRRDTWYEVMTRGARCNTGVDAIEWAHTAVNIGVGELVVTSIDNQGTSRGFDTDLLGQLVDTKVPVVMSGGFGEPSHALECARLGASGVAISNALHYNPHITNDTKMFLSQSGIPVRME